MRVQTCCDDCDWRAEQDTMTEGLAACQRHVILTSHTELFVASPYTGWTRYLPVNYTLTASGLARAKKLYG